MEEYIDVLNEDGSFSGKIATRKDIHKFGYLHKTVLILAINSKGELLIQKRAANRKKKPNMWDITCAGHLKHGDTSISGAKRELEEELGIVFKEEDFKLIHTNRKKYTSSNGLIENEIRDIYLCKVNIDINKVLLQEDEVSDVKYIPFEEYVKKIEAKDKEFNNRYNEFKEVIEIIKLILTN